MEEYALFVSDHPFLIGGFFALLGLIIWTEFTRLTRKYQMATPAQAVQILNNDKAFILDIREDREMVSGKIANAKHIPSGKLKERLRELNKFKAFPTLVYCQSGTRSGMACQTLTKDGFENVHNLSGGLSAWESANLPLSKK